MKTIQEIVVPAREYLALTIKKGQTLRLIDLEGRQVIDVIFFNLNDLEERSSCVVTTLFNKTTTFFHKKAIGCLR